MIKDQPTELLQLVQELWWLKRDIVSDGFDQALERLAQEIPMTIHQYPTGSVCWTWRIPERWTCVEGYLETLDGRRLLDYADHPLHVISYSLSFEGVVSREVLFQHLHVHPRLADAIPFVFKYYDRDWGLCCSQVLRDTLNDPEYRVVLRTRFDPGTLKVGEILIPGERHETFVMVAHLCHPAMFNDDLSGVVVGLDVMRRLSQRYPEPHRPHYTYRLLILPETIGSVAYLSNNEQLIPQMTAGLFLEMLGNAAPHALQGSFMPASQADKVLSSLLRGLSQVGGEAVSAEGTPYSAPYRMVINNDERQFNAPGVRIPMLSLSRVEAQGSPTRPYREYHSSLDTPEIVGGAGLVQRLEASRDLVLEMIQAWENNQFVVNRFKGEVFCSGYGIWVDYRVNPEGHRRLFEIMERCDGERTVADIAHELQISFQSTWEVIRLLDEKGLVSLSRRAQPTDPHR